MLRETIGKDVLIGLIALAAICVVVVAVAVVIYGNRVHATTSRRLGRSKPLRLIENSYVSAESLNLLTHKFEDDEDVVHWADRQHMIVLLPGLITGLASLLFLALAGFLAFRLGPVHFNLGNKPVHHIHTSITAYIWILPALIGILLLLLPWNLWLRWRAFIRSITNKNARTHIQPWPWAWWLWGYEENDPQPLHIIQTIEDKVSFIGRAFGYGTLIIITQKQEEEIKTTHVWQYLRHYEEVAELLMKLKDEAKLDYEKTLGSPSSEGQKVIDLVELWKPSPN